ncbi:VIT1/CCC1 transporter family protein [Donghicola sp. XS_ASV15]|uniref:VIT1/CCC1 transporter family protein n=1 Tax=Donghicola sp. XS_ASV15 TaxID=3241295 RepID=UPI0035162FD6
MQNTSDSEESKGIAHMRDFLKQIVFGGNDGIVTTFAIVAGFAGAQAEGTAQIGGIAVLVFGLANLFADAVSMGLGEFLSLRSRNAMYRTRRGTIAADLHKGGRRAANAVEQFLTDRGIPNARAREIGTGLSEHPDVMAELAMMFAHGMTDPDGESPWKSGLVTFGAFVLFGALPLLPYFLGDTSDATLGWSATTTIVALVALGLLRWRVTEDAAPQAIGETVLVGALCAGVAYGVGWMVGG